ncbi:MAG: hypothetical protein P8M11_16965 [Planctomycetota bacterium]|nr:hypothetical protein [Planctomycetota bacterium]
MSSPHKGSPTSAPDLDRRSAPPAWTDPAFLALALAAVALGAWSWLRVEGALFADVVEYLERARALVAGEALIDAQKVRAAGVTALHAPALWLANLFGQADGPWVLAYAAFVHVGISVGFLAATRRLALAIAQAAGLEGGALRLAGLLAACGALSSPTLLQFMAIPMTDVAAGAALAMGMERGLFGPSTAQGGRSAGGWLGIAVLCAFKAIPPVLLILATMAARNLLSGSPRDAVRALGGAASSFAVLLLIQCVFDRLTYGQFGVGLWTYLLINFGPQSGQLLYEIGAVDLGQWLYQQGANAIGDVSLEDVSRSTDDFRAIAGRTWYVDNYEWFSPRWLAPAVALGAAAAALGAIRSKSGAALRVLMPLGIALAFAALTSFKGSKDMRIWLPVLPAYAAYMGVGLLALAGKPTAPAARLRAAVVATLMLAGVLHAALHASRTPTAPFGAFERAARWLEEAPVPVEGRAPRVASSYHWAVLFRTPADWELEKLPFQLDSMTARQDPEAMASSLSRLEAQDALLLHSSLLYAPWASEVVDVLSREFHVAAAFWDRTADTGTGAVLAFTRHVPQGARRRVPRAVSPSLAPERRRVRLERPLGPEREVMSLDDLRVERLPGDGLFWAEVDISQRGEVVRGGYALGLRVSDASGQRGYTAYRRPDWGRGDVRSWPEGTTWTEGFLLAPDQGPLSLQDSFEPIRSGARAHLWFDMATLDADAQGRRLITGRLEPIDPEGVHAERDDVGPGAPRSDDGWRFSPIYGELLIGSFATGSKAIDLRLEGGLAAE